MPKNVSRVNIADDDEADGKSGEGAREGETRFDRLRRRTNQDVLSNAFQKLRGEDAEDSGDELLQVAPVQQHATLGDGDDDDDDDAAPPARPKSRKERARKPTVVSLRRAELQGAGQRVIFDEDGTAVVQGPKLAGLDMSSAAVAQHAFAREHRELQLAARDMSKADVIDREMYKERLRAKKRERKAKLRALRVPEGFEAGPGGVQLAAFSGSDEDEDGAGMSEDEHGGQSGNVPVDMDFALLDETTYSDEGNANDDIDYAAHAQPAKRSGHGEKRRHRRALADSEEDDEKESGDEGSGAPCAKRPLRSLEDEALRLLTA